MDSDRLNRQCLDRHRNLTDRRCRDRKGRSCSQDTRPRRPDETRGEKPHGS